MTILSTLPAADEIHVVFLNLDVPIDLQEALWEVLNDVEKNRAERLLKEELRNRFIAVHGFLRCLLGNYLHISPRSVPIGIGGYNKPFVAGLEFSISHSRHRAVMVFSRQTSVGVDLEIIDEEVSLHQVAGLAFSVNEFEDWQALAVNQQRDGFYQIWTCKEALLKALGSGMRLSPRSFTIKIAPTEAPVVQVVDHPLYSEAIKASVLYRLDAGRDAAASLAVMGRGPFHIVMFQPQIEDWNGWLRT